jgi:predicted nucleic acid-binding Zn ribbon protein
MSYQDYWFDGWMRDQISLFVTHFECQVCEGEFPLKEKAKDSYSNTCLTCAAEIKKDLEDWA